MALTNKQRRFVEEYLVDLNATQAAIRAGYSAKAANREGTRLLSNAVIATAIAEAQAERSKRTELDQDWVLERLKRVAERSLQEEELLAPDGSPRGEFVFNAGGANRALELLGKHLGMFTDKHQHDVGDSLAKLMALANGTAIRPKDPDG